MKNLSRAILVSLIGVSLCLLASCGAGSQSASTSKQQAPTPTTPPTPTPTPPPTPTPAPTPSDLPTPPSGALVFTNLEEKSGWQTCSSADCAGGTGKGASWMAQNQATPSMDGNSLELYNSGVWANSLWWQKTNVKSSATNLLWDFYAQVDASAVQAAQALEFDAFQFVGGYNYMMGSQCDLGEGVWDVWDELNGHWIHTSAPCKTFAPDVWHHIQWYITRDASKNSYTFVTLVVDGTAYTLNQTYSAKNLGWSDNVGVQYQLDVNATGSGYHEWIDQSTLTIW